MKQIFLLLVCTLFAHFAFSQETTCDYVPYQDSLLVMRCVTVTETGYDGLVNVDTTYSVPPVDSAQIVEQVTVQALNNSNRYVARFRNNAGFRRFFAETSAADDLLELLGTSYHEQMTGIYSGRLIGSYKVVTSDSTHFVDIVSHPVRTDRLRASDIESGENWNITVWARDLIELNNYSGASRYLVLTEVSEDRRVYQDIPYFLPSRFLNESSEVKLVKID